MRTLIWLVAGLLAVVWTGMVALSVELSGWLLNAVASAPAVGAATGPLPVPTWLAPWVDTEWFAALQVLWMNGAQWLAQWVPGAGGLMEWITPLLWTGWALGLLPLLAFALFLHWLAGRGNPVAALHNAQA
jgi:uncharacterized protein involved in cysteine biosynthesis